MFPTQPDIGQRRRFCPFHHHYPQAQVKPTFLDHQSHEAQVLPHIALVDTILEPCPSRPCFGMRMSTNTQRSGYGLPLPNTGTGFEVVLLRGGTNDTCEAYGDPLRWLSVSVHREINVTQERCQKDHSRLRSPKALAVSSNRLLMIVVVH